MKENAHVLRQNSHVSGEEREERGEIFFYLFAPMLAVHHLDF